MPNTRVNIQKLLFRWGSILAILFIFSFPFHHNILPNLGGVLNAPFQFVSGWFCENVLEVKNYHNELDSDTTILYVHVLMLFMLSFLLAITSFFISFNKKRLILSKQVFILFISYYLGSVLLMYGFDKIFKHQFYLPEPNTLYTPLGDLSKDIAFWSVMGASRSYSVFSGIIEVVPAILLFFNRTRLVGALISLLVLINVAMLNFSFDISVKIFSLFLVFLSMIIISIKRKYLFDIFFRGRATNQTALMFKVPGKRLKTVNLIVVFMLFADSLYPYFYFNNFNDDLSARPLYHGVYKINEFALNGVKYEDCDKPFSNLFIHRKGYLIFQDKENNFIDYKLYVDSVNHTFTLVDYDKKAMEMHYSIDNDKLTVVKGNLGNNYVEFYVTEQQWKDMPLIKDSFSWTID